MEALSWPQAFVVVGLAWAIMTPLIIAIWAFCRLGVAYFENRPPAPPEEPETGVPM